MSKYWPHIVDQEDYNHYVERVNAFLERERITKLSPDMDEETGEWKEHEFTWTPCECCGRKLGGARVEASDYSQERGEIVGPFEVCYDCIHYLEYGQLDDLTMLDIELTEENIIKWRENNDP